ncbi:MAG: hypothetical protein ABSE51_21750 [Terracidiphilus sp.]
MPDFRSLCRPLKFPPHARVGVRESAEFDGACEDPVLRSRKVGPLLAGLQALQQFACEIKGPGGAFRLHIGDNLLNDATPDAES